MNKIVHYLGLDVHNQTIAVAEAATYLSVSAAQNTFDWRAG